jgi:phenylpropionate dioxygenase-like ring-hydroxylating dioxygenase large terminal subunit
MLTQPDLGTVGPVLSDGTPVRELVDDDRNEVSMRVLVDREIYELELEHLFARTWNLLAHETEIPNAGDFVTRYIGEDPVVVVREPSGGVNVALNVCSHRGMKVCRVDAGTARQLRCPYHGWTFDLGGRFLGAPIAQEQMHGDIMTKSELGLRRARVETFAGFVFATWDDTAPSLDDHLGPIKRYMQLMFERTEDGLEVLGPPQRFLIPANWKCAGEQHAGDGYHALSLHRSLQELGIQKVEDGDPAPAMYGVDVSANAHGFRCIDQRESYWASLDDQDLGDRPLDRLMAVPPPGLTAEQVPALAERFTDEELRVLTEFRPEVGGMFPNIGAFAVNFPTPDGVVGIISWHAFVPKGPERFEFYNWFLVERGTPPELRDAMAELAGLAFGISGFIETDDADTWPQMTASARGVMGRRQKIRYQALIGEKRPADWPDSLGGHVYEGFSKDDNQWQWWRRWAEFVAGDPWHPSEAPA